MIQSTFIARVADGLFLAADEESYDLTEYRNQAKMLLKRLTPQSDQRCSIETGNLVFHYLIEFGVCYLCLCDKAYPRKLAFAYLEDIQQEFQEKYGDQVGTVARPYALMKFDTYIQKVKKQYQDSRTQRNLNKLNEDLQDVTRIMTRNIHDVLGRGEALDRMSTASRDLADRTKEYHKNAKQLNLQALYQKYGPPVIVLTVVTLVVYIRFWWW
ncbi:Longin-like domain-containing protein [Phlyctochytrium arcticum]|nr:Longin-like domain-containing protein [Phlyctochytrium arcticum]